MEHDARLQRLLFEADGNAIRLRRPGAAVRTSEGKPATISACSQAILMHYGIDPANPGEFAPASSRTGIEIRDVQSLGAHLTMTIVLPMAWNGWRMTIATSHPATIHLPGMTFSPAIATAAIGRPVGRLAGLPALDGRLDLLVTGVEHAQDGGVNTAILHFHDGAESLNRDSQATCEALQ
jgi:hypothetical protein